MESLTPLELNSFTQASETGARVEGIMPKLWSVQIDISVLIGKEGWTAQSLPQLWRGFYKREVTLLRGDTKWEQIKYVTGARGNKRTWHPSKCLATAIM